MLILSKSLLQTSTQITVPINSILAENIMTRDETRQYITYGYADETSPFGAYIRIDFDDFTQVDYLALVEMNFREFDVRYYDSSGSDLLYPLAPGQDTTDAYFLNNTQKSMIMELAPVMTNRLEITAWKTIVPNSEKAVGWVAPCKKLTDFTRLPSYKDYDVLRKNEEVVHKLSNGGTRINLKDKKFQADIKLKYVPLDFKNTLKQIHKEVDEFIFCGFPSMVDWDEVCFPCVWEGSFDFENFSNNAPDTGFDGLIKLRETP